VAFRQIGKPVSLVLYLGLAWLVLGFLRPLAEALPSPVRPLLVAGGVINSLGALIHADARIPFQNVIWQALVTIAADLHFVAVARLSVV
jgi:channel protein (hemolysin III family)